MEEWRPHMQAKVHNSALNMLQSIRSNPVKHYSKIHILVILSRDGIAVRVSFNLKHYLNGTLRYSNIFTAPPTCIHSKHYLLHVLLILKVLSGHFKGLVILILRVPIYLEFDCMFLGL